MDGYRCQMKKHPLHQTWYGKVYVPENHPHYPIEHKIRVNATFYDFKPNELSLGSIPTHNPVKQDGFLPTRIDGREKVLEAMKRICERLKHTETKTLSVQVEQ
jgi:hypothetical protein